MKFRIISLYGYGFDYKWNSINERIIFQYLSLRGLLLFIAFYSEVCLSNFCKFKLIF